MKLELEELRVILSGAPNGTLLAAYPILRGVMLSAGITTLPRQAAFLATIGHESNDLTVGRENMMYSPRRLMQVWPARFPTLASALPFAYQPQKLANNVYANRLGNGPPSSGDGWRYRGGGWIQTTGRTNYREVGLEKNPELITQPAHAARAAVTFWTNRNLNALADQGEPAFDDLCRRVNGGLVGYADRLERYRRALRVLQD